MSQTLYITGGTVIDGVSESPVENATLVIRGGRIEEMTSSSDAPPPPGARVIDAEGKFVIPGLMNANVHLYQEISVEGLVLYEGRYEEVIIEGAQIALRNGLTTLFDTWGPRRHLMNARDQIASGSAIGSRIFCAGNIIGLDGPFSDDFIRPEASGARSAFANRINAKWVENTGRHLMWLTPDQVAGEIRDYVSRGVDFLKYAANDHSGAAGGAYLTFSPRVQARIVEEAHKAGITAQAHSMSVEGLHGALEAGCDLVTHSNLTGPTPIPDDTLQLFAERQAGAVIFPFTDRGLDWMRDTVSPQQWSVWQSSDVNARKLIAAGVPLLLANDGAVFSTEKRLDPNRGSWWGGEYEEGALGDLATGHFYWLRAMEEKGCDPMRLLQSATINIARAYGMSNELGSLEVGKIADIVVLDANPLDSAANYRRIHAVVKEGALIELESLPLQPILTAPQAETEPEELAYKPFHTPAKRVSGTRTSRSGA